MDKDNVVIDPEGRALICDLGCARTVQCSLSLAKLTSTPKGTQTCWAPELVNSTENPTTQSKETDVWAFGMTVYVCKFLLLFEIVEYSLYKFLFLLIK